jgi:LysM repeat protein
MIHRSIKLLTAISLTLAVATVPSFGQATNAPTAPAATPPASSAPAPAATTAPATAAPDVNAPRPTTYTLQAGDTLESVGKQWGITGRRLQKYNHFTNAQVRRLQIGQVIKIPPAPSTSK